MEQEAETSQKGRPRGPTKDWTRQHGPLNKNGRRDSTCAFCEHKFISTRPEQVHTHLLDECKQVPNETKDQFSEHVANKKGGGPLKAPVGKRLRSGLESSNTSAVASNSRPCGVVAVTPTTAKVTPAVRRELDAKLVRAFVHTGLPFAAVDNPYLLDLLATLRPQYQPPGNCAVAARGLQPMSLRYRSAADCSW